MTDSTADATDNEALRRLVEQWRYQHKHAETDWATASVFEECADQLVATIDDDAR